MSQQSPEIEAEIEAERDGTEPPLETIYEDESLRVSGIRGGDKALFIAFTGIGHRLGAMQREEFVRVSQGGGEHSVLFVQDRTRSWYNDPGFAEKVVPIVRAWGERCGKIVTIGNSMGGFGAIAFADLFDADVAIAFSPQLSISRRIVPQENRWSEFTSRVDSFIYESAATQITDGPQYFIFQGDGGKDWYHVGGFPIRPNVCQYVIPNGPHNLASILKARGFLSKIVAACTDGDLEALREAIVTYNGAVLRTAENDRYAAGSRPIRGARLDPNASMPALPKPSRQLHTVEERREIRRTNKRVGRQQQRWADKQTDRLDRREAAKEELLAKARAEVAAKAAAETAAVEMAAAEQAAAEKAAAEKAAAEKEAAKKAAAEKAAAERAAADRNEPRPGLETVFEDETLQVSGIRGGNKILFIAFTEIGDRVGPLRREELIDLTRAAAGENSVLFVGDRQRTWYNAPAFLERLQPIVAEWRARCERTVTIGNSMGGFGAVVFAGALGADTAIAFSPQFSVSKRIVPKEDRWSEFVSKIGEFRYESAGDYIVDGCTYFLFQGDGGKDWYQIGGFPIRPNLHQFIVRDGPHTLASLLKLRGDLAPIILASVAGDLKALNELMFAQGNARLRSEDNDPYKAATRPRRDLPRGEPLRTLPLEPVVVEVKSPEEQRTSRRAENQQKRRAAKHAERETQRKRDQLVLAELAHVDSPKTAADDTGTAAVTQRGSAADKRKAAAAEKRAALVEKGKALAAAKAARREQRLREQAGFFARIGRFFRGLFGGGKKGRQSRP